VERQIRGQGSEVDCRFPMKRDQKRRFGFSRAIPVLQAESSIGAQKLRRDRPVEHTFSFARLTRDAVALTINTSLVFRL